MREHPTTSSSWKLLRAAATAGVLLALATGCQSASRRKVATAEPSLAASPDGGTTIAATPAPRTVTFVDRHPLFSKPRDYYESSGNNKVVKAAAATVIGIPAGIFGELKQIVVGAPGEVRY